MAGSRRTAQLAFGAHGHGAVRLGRWKWLRLTGRELLFDVEAGPQERANRAEAEPATAADLRARWEARAATLLPYPPGIWSVDVKRPGNLADRYWTSPRRASPLVERDVRRILGLHAHDMIAGVDMDHLAGHA